MSSAMTLLQGLNGNTLVAGKTTAIRVFTDSWSLADVSGMTATVLRPDGSRLLVAWPRADIVFIPVSNQGPSVVARITGRDLSFVGEYYFTVQVIDNVGAVAARLTLDRSTFLPTKDLRVIVSRLWSGTSPPAKLGEIEAVAPAMQRLAALYPIRDGISTFDGNASAGLRYFVNDNPKGPPDQDSHICPLLAAYSNRPAPFDNVDLAITYRFPDPSEGSGGNSNHVCANQNVLYSVIVWGAPLATVFSQETAHRFGLEAAKSPHMDPNFDSAHSKDETVDATDADLGFDIQFNQPFPDPTYDIMYPNGPDPEYPDQSHSLNSWDWEYLRQQLLSLSSTGPGRPFLTWRDLGGTSLRPYPVVGKNGDGRQEVFVLGGDRRLWHRWEQSAGDAWHDWSSLDGVDLSKPIVVASNADGRLQVFVCGSDGRIYSRWQTAVSGGWSGWNNLGGELVRGYAVTPNRDGRLELVAVWNDGALHGIWQTAPNGGWSAWATLDGHKLQGSVALGRNADGRLEAFVVGGDGSVYHKWQTRAGHAPWSAWKNMGQPTQAKVGHVDVRSGADGSLHVFMMRTDNALSYRAQHAPNGGFSAMTDLGGHDLQWPCAVGRNPDGRLEVFVIGGNRQLYNRWQVDPTRPAVWSDWTNLGGSDIQPGVGMGSSPSGELEVFVIGGDGKLYRGLRS